MTIGLSRGGPNLYTSAGPPNEVLAGPNNGRVLLRHSGDGWQAAACGLPGLHISSVLAEPVSGTFFAGAFFGSVMCLEAWAGGSQVFAATSAGDGWWSEDEGDHWQCIASGLGGVAEKLHDVLLSSADLSKVIPMMAR